MLKPISRSQSQLLPRRSFKPNRILRLRPTVGRNLLFRPARGSSTLKSYEYQSP